MQAPSLGPVGTYLGPIHEVDVTTRLVAVLVPHPADATLLVWVNVWTSVNRWGLPSSVDYCHMVDDSELQAWHDAGWEDRFLD